MAIETGNRNQATKGAEGQSMISIVGRSEPNCNNNLRGRGNKNGNDRYSGQENECRNCEKTWNQNHRKNCPAKGQTCRKFNGRNHYARVCRSQNNHSKQSKSADNVQKSDILSNE